MKNLFLFVIVIAACFFAYKKFGSQQDWQADGNQAHAYKVLDMKFHVQGRDFSFKAVGEYSSQSTCETLKDESLIDAVKQFCSSIGSCQSSSISACSASVDPKYTTMLNQSNANVYYLHAQNGNKQRAVMVFWGLNDAEGKQVCEAGKQQLLSQHPEDDVQCIPA